MGWEQVVFPLTLINEYQGTIINFDYAEDSIRQQLNNETECTNFINQYIEGQYLDIQSIPSSETTIYEKDSYTISVRWANANTPNTPGIVINFNFPDGVNKITAMSDYSGYMSRMRYIKFGIAINEDTQRATCIIGGYCSYNNNYFCNIDGITFSVNVRDQYEQQLYEWIIPAKPDPQGATIKVNYYLPDYEYTYAKITYKQDSEPDSETDGESVEILKDETSVNIEGLEEEKTYYFKIFTDKSESEVFQYTVSEIPGPIIPPDLQPYVDLLASYGVGTNQTSSLTNCQDYSGNSNTVSMEGYSVCIDGNFNVNGNQYHMYVMTNCDIRVTNNNGSISVEYSCTMAPYDTIKTWGRSMWGEYSNSGNRIEYLALGIWTPAVPLDFYQPYNVDNVGITFTTSFNSITDCMNYLTQHFRRCNLYVDGKQWLKVN